MANGRSDISAVTTELTSVVTQLRRALRRSIRTDFPWETRPAAQVEVLQMLRDAGPTRLGELAARLRLAQSTMSALVTALVGDGLVDRAVDARDRRANVLQLSPAGRNYLRGWDAAHRRRLGGALRALNSQDRAQIAAALPSLARLADALDSGAAGDGRPQRS